MDEQPKNVKELLVELKDASELMVDLAYAAVFFNEEKLAREVERIEERMRENLRRLRQMAMLAARRPEPRPSAVRRAAASDGARGRHPTVVRARSGRRHPHRTEGPRRGRRGAGLLLAAIQQPGARGGGRRPGGPLGHAARRARIVGPARGAR